MVFKTSIIEISNAISQIQKIRVAEGLNGLFDATTVQQYTLAISGLNKQEAITLLQRQGLSTAQQAQILSSAGLLQTTQMLNASLVEEAVLNSKISGEKAKQILTELGLIEAKTGNLVVTKECTVAEVAQALATKGIVGADAEAILSQLGLATANTTTTVSFSGLTTAIKANTVAMAKWLVTNPVGWCILAVGAIYGLTKAYDALTVSEEEMAEAHEESAQKVKDSISKYEELKQELETIQQTYEDNEQKLKDLYKLRENQTITQAEQDYLEELEGQNEKLRQQIEYKKTLSNLEAKEAEDEAVKTLNEKTQDDLTTGRPSNGGATTTYDKITDAEKIKQNTGTINELTSDLVAYEKVIKGIDLSQEEIDKYNQQLVAYQEQLNSIEGDSDSANEQREYYQGKIDEVQGLLNGTITYEQYEKAVADTTTKVQGLVSENDTLLQTVEPLNDAIKSTSGENYELKKTNDEIIANAKDAAIAFNGYTDSLNGTANALGTVGENGNKIDVLPTISQTIDNLKTRLKPTMDALKEAYQDIFKSEDGKIKFSLDDVDISTFETIKSAIGELDEIEGIEINYDDFDNFVKVLSDTSSTSDEVQAQFDKLSTSIVYSADCTQMTKDNFDLLVKSLYEMGLVNAEEVLTNIKNAQEELKTSGINLINVTAEEAEAFIEEAEASDIAIQYLRMYMLQKELANDNPLDTSESIQSLKKLCEQLGMTCNALGKTSELMQAVLSLESATNAISAGVDYGGQYSAQAEAARKKIEEIKNGSFEDYNFNFDSNVTSPSKSDKSSSKDNQSKETIDFIEIAIKRIEEAIDKLKTKAENTFIGFEVRAKHYVSLLGKVTDEINLQSQAYQAYMARANSVGLSEVYASQVRDGSLNIVDITDDKLKEQIKDYQTWYEKAKECQDKVEELKITQIELTQANLELLITKYEKLAEKVSSANDRIQGKLDLKEAWGFHATSGSYTSMNKNIIKQIDYIKKQDEELKKLLNTVEKGSEAWLEYQARLDDNKKSLQDLTKEMAENAKAVAELSSAKAERKVEKYDKSDEKLDAKIDNSIKYKNQNKYLYTEMKNIDRRQNAYDNAVKTDEKGIATTSKAINKTKSNKENKSILKKIKSLVKQKKKISESLLKQASKLGDNGALYDKCVRYNAYISAYEIDKDIADLYRKTSQQDKADIVQKKLDNIQTYYKTYFHRHCGIHRCGQKCCQRSSFYVWPRDSRRVRTRSSGSRIPINASDRIFGRNVGGA